MIVTRNASGAIVIFGEIGTRQYYFYTERQAIRLYREEVDNTIIVNRKP